MLKRGFNNLEKVADVITYTEKPDEFDLGIVREYKITGNISGYLDYLTGDKKYMLYKYQEDTTHLFISKYKADVNNQQFLKIDDKFYKVVLVDHPLDYKTTEIQIKQVKELIISE